MKHSYNFGRMLLASILISPYGFGAKGALAQTAVNQVPQIANQTSGQVGPAVSQALQNYNQTISPPSVPVTNPTQGDQANSAVPSTAGYQSELDEMSELQRQLTIIQDKQQIAQAALTIENTIQSIKQAEQVSSQPAANAAPVASSYAQQQQASANTFVTMVTGVPGALKAFVSVNGAPMVVSAGTMLPSGAKVVSVTQSGVYTDGANGAPSFIGMTGAPPATAQANGQSGGQFAPQYQATTNAGIPGGNISFPRPNGTVGFVQPGMPLSH